MDPGIAPASGLNQHVGPQARELFNGDHHFFRLAAARVLHVDGQVPDYEIDPAVAAPACVAMPHEIVMPAAAQPLRETRFAAAPAVIAPPDLQPRVIRAIARHARRHFPVVRDAVRQFGVGQREPLHRELPRAVLANSFVARANNRRVLAAGPLRPLHFPFALVDPLSKSRSVGIVVRPQLPPTGWSRPFPFGTGTVGSFEPHPPGRGGSVARIFVCWLLSPWDAQPNATSGEVDGWGKKSGRIPAVHESHHGPYPTGSEK